MIYKVKLKGLSRTKLGTRSIIHRNSFGTPIMSEELIQNLNRLRLSILNVEAIYDGIGRINFER